MRPTPSVSCWPNLMRWGFPSSSLAAQPLHVVIESAAAVERTHENAAKSRRDLDAAHRKATGAVARKRKDLEKAEAEWKEWTSAWEAALKALQFPATSTPETAEAQINAIDDMREAAGRINDLRHERIEKIERDMKAFEADVAALAQAIAPQLLARIAEDAVLELDRLAAEATRVRDLKAAKDSDISAACRRRSTSAANRAAKPAKSSRGSSRRPVSHRSTNSGSPFSARTRCGRWRPNLIGSRAR